MAATRFLSARPIPVIDCLICSAENSVTSILPANSVAKITPRASPTESDVLALTLEKTRSTHRPKTAANVVSLRPILRQSGAGEKHALRARKCG